MTKRVLIAAGVIALCIAAVPARAQNDCPAPTVSVQSAKKFVETKAAESNGQSALNSSDDVAQLGDTVELTVSGLPDLLAVLRAIPDDVDTALLVGHNPGFEELTAALASRDEEEVTLPTAALARIDLDVSRWDGVEKGTGVLRGITTPRSLT